MKRRDFLRGAMAGGVVGAISTSGEAGLRGEKGKSKAAKNEEGRVSSGVFDGAARYSVLPDKLGGMSLEQLREDYRERLFNHYLPFWDKGGYDKQYGGFMCELKDDGTVESD